MKHFFLPFLLWSIMLFNPCYSNEFRNTIPNFRPVQTEPNKNPKGQGKQLERLDVIEDVKLLQTLLKNYHPGLYTYISPIKLDNNFASLISNLPEYPTEGYLQRELALLLGQIKCGHTYLNPWNANEDVFNRIYDDQIYFPLLFEVVENQLIVTENLSDDQGIKKGAKIHAINGHKTQEIIEKIKQVIKGDGFAADDHRLSELGLDQVELNDRDWFDMYFHLFFPITEGNFSVEYQNFKSRKRKLAHVKAMTRSDRANKASIKVGTRPKFWKRKTFKTVEYLHVSDFAIWNWDFDYKVFLKNFFGELQEQGVNQLIIDLRGNSGGLPEVANELLSYLSDKPIACPPDILNTTVYNGAKEEHKEVLFTGEPLLKEELPENILKPIGENRFQVMIPDVGCTVIAPKPNGFTGEVILLIDGRNASAGFQFAQKFRFNKLGTIIGTKTGGNTMGINGSKYFFAKLPKTGFEIDIPLIRQQFFLNAKDETIIPDIPIKNKQVNLAKGQDAILTKALEFLERR